MIDVNEIKAKTFKEILAECHDDQVGLWSIIASLKFNGAKAFSNTELQKITLELVRDLFDEVDIVALNYEKPLWHLWDHSIDSAIMRIKNEWDEIGHPPELNDRHIVWFTTNKLAQLILPKSRV